MKHILTMLLALVLLAGSAGVARAQEGKEAAVTSSTLYVEKVEGLGDDFILGADVSVLLAEEESGVTFKDFDGAEQDMLRTLAENGLNYVRVRVWVDPFDARGRGYGGGNCTAETAAKIGSRAARYGMKLLVDFHYSDFWADPSKQMVPKGWAGLSIAQKAEKVRAYTAQSLTTIRAAGADIGMVQIGNETTTGVCGEDEPDKMCAIFRAGAEAVRAFDPNILIALHFTDPQAWDYLELARMLADNGVDYDVFGSSYYPFWHGTLDNLRWQLAQVAEKYHKKVMVAETQWPYTPEDGDDSGNTAGADAAYAHIYPYTVQGQSREIRDVVATVASVENGIGVFYWEAGWIPVPGNSRDERSALWEKYGSGWASSYAGEYDPRDAGQYYGGSACDNQALFDFEGHPLESLKTFALLRSGNGADEGADAGQTGGNYLKNSGFEGGDLSMWTVFPLTSREQADFQTYALDAHSGEVALHFWDQEPIEFRCEQAVTDLPAGSWRVSAFAQGDDVGADADIYLYAVADGISYAAPVTLRGWVNWQAPVLEHIPCVSGTMTVGVYVRCQAGGWGTFDDFELTLEN